jgi:hypothetical protein
LQASLQTAISQHAQAAAAAVQGQRELAEQRQRQAALEERQRASEAALADMAASLEAHQGQEEALREEQAQLQVWAAGCFLPACLPGSLLARARSWMPA